jgi:hypothetical protein
MVISMAAANARLLRARQVLAHSKQAESQSSDAVNRINAQHFWSRRRTVCPSSAWQRPTYKRVVQLVTMSGTISGHASYAGRQSRAGLPWRLDLADGYPTPEPEPLRWHHGKKHCCSAFSLAYPFRRFAVHFFIQRIVAVAIRVDNAPNSCDRSGCIRIALLRKTFCRLASRRCALGNSLTSYKRTNRPTANA